jgi:hypothetical protein
MKQGGLDTLAALCGGASKAYTEEREDEKFTPTYQTGASGPAPAPSNQPYIASRTDTGPHGQSIVQPAPPVAPTGPMDPSMQQWQSLATAAAAYGSVPNPAAFASLLQAAAQNPAAFQQSPASTVDPNLYIQQFAYYQYLAAAQAQQMASQNSQQMASQNAQQMASQNSQQMVSQNSQQMVVAVQGPTHPTTQVVQPAFTIDPNLATPYIYVGHQCPAHHQASSGELQFTANHKEQDVRQIPALSLNSLLWQIRTAASFFTCDVGGIDVGQKLLW